MATKKKKKKRGGLFFNILVVLACVAVLIFIFRNNPVIYPYFSKLWPERLSVSDSGNFLTDNVSQTVMCADKLVYYDTDTLYNEDGWSYELKMVSPKLHSRGQALMAQSVQDGRCEVFSGFKHLYTVSDISGIILSDVSSSGGCVIVSSEPGYRCKVTVYDKGGKDVFKAYFGNKYIVDAHLSDNGKKLALCLFDISGDEYVSTVAFYDIGQEQPYAQTEDKETVFSNIHIFPSGKAVSVGDTKVMGFSASGDAKWQYSYDGASLQKFSFGGEDSVVLCLKKGQQEVVFLNSDGDNYSYTHKQSDITDVNVNSDAVMAVTPKSIMFITTRGYLIAQKNLSTDVKNIHMPSSGRRGMVIHNFGFETFEAE